MLIKVLAIIFLVIVSFRLLARFFLPLLGKYAIKKVTETMQERVKTQQEGERIYQDGKVEIRKVNKSDPNSHEDDSNSDYIDYEEVK